MLRHWCWQLHFNNGNNVYGKHPLQPHQYDITIYPWSCLQSALQLSEVLKERDAQVELKILKAKASEGQDREWMEKAQREYEDSIRRDQEAARKRMMAAAENANFIQKQYVFPFLNIFLYTWYSPFYFCPSHKCIYGCLGVALFSVSECSVLIDVHFFAECLRTFKMLSLLLAN